MFTKKRIYLLGLLTLLVFPLLGILILHFCSNIDIISILQPTKIFSVNTLYGLIVGFVFAGLSLKIFNSDFYSDIFLAGDFYNRIKFNVERFSNSMDLIAKSVNNNYRNSINVFIKESLKKEGYDVKVKQNAAQTKIVFESDDIELYDPDEEAADDSPIVIFINY